LEGLRRSLIIQELKGWPGQNHELHGLQQTTIKGGGKHYQKQPLQPRNKFSTSSKTETQIKRQEEEKDQYPVTSKHSLPNSMKTVKSLYTTLLIPSRDPQ
jgi:hypothetical protein